MDKDFLRTLSDLELVTLQYEARKNDDQVFVDDILIVLGEREKQSTPERLRYIRLSETEYEYEIVIQFDGGVAIIHAIKVFANLEKK